MRLCRLTDTPPKFGIHLCSWVEWPSGRIIGWVGYGGIAVIERSKVWTKGVDNSDIGGHIETGLFSRTESRTSTQEQRIYCMHYQLIYEHDNQESKNLRWSCALASGQVFNTPGYLKSLQRHNFLFLHRLTFRSLFNLQNRRFCRF